MIIQKSPETFAKTFTPFSIYSVYVVLTVYLHLKLHKRVKIPSHIVRKHILNLVIGVFSVHAADEGDVI